MKQTEFMSKCADKSAFTALLNCAEVGQRNRISSKLPISVPLSHHILRLMIDTETQVLVFFVLRPVQNGIKNSFQSVFPSILE